MVEMTVVYRTHEVAEELGVQSQTISRAARRIGVGRKYGRDWMFTREDIEKLRDRTKPGRPQQSGTPHSEE